MNSFLVIPGMFLYQNMLLTSHTENNATEVLLPALPKPDF
jgi:hypothetical protein